MIFLKTINVTKSQNIKLSSDFIDLSIIKKSILYLFIIPLSCYHNKTRIIPAKTYLTFLKISTWYYSLILVNDIQKISMAQIIKNITRSNG